MWSLETCDSIFIHSFKLLWIIREYEESPSIAHLFDSSSATAIQSLYLTLDQLHQNKRYSDHTKSNEIKGEHLWTKSIIASTKYGPENLHAQQINGGETRIDRGIKKVKKLSFIQILILYISNSKEQHICCIGSWFSMTASLYYVEYALRLETSAWIKLNHPLTLNSDHLIIGIDNW